MELTWRHLLVAGAAGVCLGYLATPVKIKTITQTVEVEKKVEKVDTERNKHQETTTTEVTKPDGTTEKTTRTIVDTKTDQERKIAESDSKSTTATTEKERGTTGLSVSALAGGAFKGGEIPEVIYGVAATKNILGPVTLGVWGLSNLTCGLSAGISF